MCRWTSASVAGWSARVCVRRARHEAQQREAASRRFKAWDLARDAQGSLDARAYGEAVERAARAVALAPNDPRVAALYVAAAERSHEPRFRLAALEHYISVVERSFQALVALADLHYAAGNLDRARSFAAEARARVPRVLRQRRTWLSVLERVERETARRGHERAAPGQEPRQGVLPLAQVAAGVAPSTQPRASEANVPVQSKPDSQRQSVTATTSTTSAAPKLSSTDSTPPPGSALTIPVSLASDILGLDALARSPESNLDEVRLALQATALRDAESFDRLLALERAEGLIRLSHQEETARKVLSVFLGRALLADEVGLGKTIEAGMVLGEYLLRGRVQTALVLVPPSLVRIDQRRNTCRSSSSVIT